MTEVAGRAGAGDGDSRVQEVERVFLIADVRGYTRFTCEHGDEAAARLAGRFAELARDAVEARSGRVVELRGDEALAVFESAAQAVRAARELAAACADEADVDESLPPLVGAGIDLGAARRTARGSRPPAGAARSTFGIRRPESRSGQRSRTRTRESSTRWRGARTAGRLPSPTGRTPCGFSTRSRAGRSGSRSSSAPRTRLPTSPSCRTARRSSSATTRAGSGSFP